MEDLFLSHLKTKIEYVNGLLDTLDADSMVVDAGAPTYYFQDDQTMPFKPNPNFALFCPAGGPEHLLQISKHSTKPKLAFFSPNDFWHESKQLGTPFWSSGFDIEVCSNRDELWSALSLDKGHNIYLGPHIEKINEHGLKNPTQSFISAIHWTRIQKTDYEVQCIRTANEIAARGHTAAKSCFFSGGSEKEIYFRYLEATGLFESELPYHNITALDEKAAVLHYQGSRDHRNGKVLLIDAGATFQGYCSDITRTYAAEAAHPTFKDLLTGVEKIQKNVSVQVMPGFSYPDLHIQASRNIGKLLLDTEVLKGISLDDIETHDLVHPFFPHGLGHALGLQVHDVGGKQLDQEGAPGEPDSKHPFLRTLRQLQENDVVTIEPGVYFIPLLLDPLRADKNLSTFVNWTLVDELMDHGGIRIEDNIVAKPEGSLNLTREFLQ